MSLHSPAEHERRRHRRYGVHDVHGSLVLQLQVRVLDMSLTGLAIESWRPLEIGGRYDLKLHHDQEELAVPAQVQWSHLVRVEPTRSGETRSVYRAGLDYRAALDDKAREILSFLEHNIVVDLERRVSGRFEVALDGPVGLTEYREFLVKEIGFFGMSIETDRQLKAGATYNMELLIGGRELEARGKVTNSRLIRRRSGRRVCEVGFAFEGLSAPSRRILESVVEEHLE